MGSAESIPTHVVEDVNLSQFKILKTIGQGSFGKVYKVEHKQRKELYALKVISKERCIKMEAVVNIIRERTILECLDHPLICNMRFAFQDNHSMYMAMDLMTGGDLRSHINNRDHNENVVKFWIAELICAVKYLHSQGIVHRDIKPDNILLDSEGHVHLSDFNIACQIPKKSEKSLISLSGTAVYFAPEIFKGKGYTEDVDWWSLGVTFYECVYGTRPWLHCTNIDELGKQVMHRIIPYPYKQHISSNCVSAIQCFLEKDHRKRLGHGIRSGWKRIAVHPFFRSIDWNCIDNKQYKPLYVPPCYDDIPLEKDNTTIHIEEEQVTAAEEGVMGWLYKKRRASRQLIQENHRKSQDLKLLQDNFKSFDYTIFDQYEGFLDQHLMTVGPPPHWVKPAFPGADNDFLPVCKVDALFGDHLNFHLHIK